MRNHLRHIPALTLPLGILIAGAANADGLKMAMDAALSCIQAAPKIMTLRDRLPQEGWVYDGDYEGAYYYLSPKKDAAFGISHSTTHPLCIFGVREMSTKTAIKEAGKLAALLVNVSPQKPDAEASSEGMVAAWVGKMGSKDVVVVASKYRDFGPYFKSADVVVGFK